ncbi:hypothetical protein [uncultured Campylobacter sp.]|uniref:hypothetical protein n=1 Tax=uncultured Campylobacter sp. TaxID=218934 RepID=UPI0015BD9D5E|nr:hypothetical protein [uncultured Campylobacter sp.]
MQFLPWAIILLLIYVIYFLMIRYEKRISTLSKLIEQNRSLIEKNKHDIEKNTKDIITNVEKVDIDLED